jgi:methyl-accepting chemotaxis protein
MIHPSLPPEEFTSSGGHMKLNIRKKLIGAFFFIVLLTIGIGGFSIYQLTQVYQVGDYVNSNTVPSVYTIGVIETKVNNYRRQQLQHIIADTAEEQKTREDNMAARDTEITALIKKYQDEMITDATDLKNTNAIEQLWKEYTASSQPVMELSRQNKMQEAIDFLNGDPTTRLNALENALEEATQYNQNLAINQAKNMKTAYDSARWITILVLVIVTAMAMSLGLTISSGISKGARLIADTAQQIGEVDLPALARVSAAIASGDLTQNLTIQTQKLTYQSGDEMGDLARMFNKTIDQLHQTGDSFAEMSSRLRDSLSVIAENAQNLSHASELLASVANQAGQATSQIATTVQQVARGTTEQSGSITHTVGSVEQMSQAIQGVAMGAQNQTREVSRTVEITNQISSMISRVSTNAQTGVKGSDQAADVAESGAKTVAATIQGMENIQAKVNLSAQKVKEMGARSNQIGNIVETIDDIASQTNMLALNAAIEAARAGEHGKGFAVVADEVRKLAEKSASATKEISELIKDIQRTVTEAVTAMQAGSNEVESGVQQVNLAGKSLSEILTAARDVNRQIREIAQEADNMSRLSDDLVRATDAVSAVVEQNTAATEEMSASSSEVSHAMESIASVSEENSAAVEEVSASAEEMTAQVEEVSASAQSLSEMARTLQQVVSQFKYSTH